ncbi:MAG: RNA-binding domain-containing protein [bacterium]
MSLELIQKLIRHKEGVHLEFKESKNKLPENLFETVCAMLNNEGGDVLLGVADNGSLIGIEPAKVDLISKNIVDLSNNSEKINPPFILFPQSYKINEKWIIHIQIPVSSQVHKSGQFIYNRSNEGDFKVTQPHQIAELFNSKRLFYTEGIVYPYLRFYDFKQELFPKIRNQMYSYNSSHPWLSLNDEQMLKKAGLWKIDYQTGAEGYTLAAALLLGKDEVIQQIVPHYKIDALLKRENIDRYDDREYIQTNLIESYEKLMNFVAKHLPEKFYLQGTQRKDLRSAIFREIIANLIIHREYTSALPATFIIYKNRVETNNANNPHGEGEITPDNIIPFAKNPTIAKFFIQLGRVEELGSGVLNVNKYLNIYVPGAKPRFIEGKTFTIIIPLISPKKIKFINKKNNDVTIAKENVMINQDDVIEAYENVRVNQDDVIVADENVMVNLVDVVGAEENVTVNQDDVIVADENVMVNLVDVVGAEENVMVNLVDVVGAEENVTVDQDNVAGTEENVTVNKDDVIVTDENVMVNGGNSLSESEKKLLIKIDLIVDTLQIKEKLTKKQLQRITGILFLLEKKQGMQSKEIAEKFGVTVRTIKRDMNYIPHLVKYVGSPKKGGYYVKKEIQDKLESEK